MHGKLLFVVTIFIHFYHSFQWCEPHTSGATIANNGYSDVRVYIDSAVPENLELLENLKTIFHYSSSALFHATRQRAYFKSVRIVVPPTWKNGSYLFATQADLNRDLAEFVVMPPNPYYKDNPYAMKNNRYCRAEGQGVHLTPDFVQNTLNSSGIRTSSKIIAQKWAEQRYGVFPEYYEMPSQSDYLSYCQYNFPFDPFTCKNPGDDTKPSSCTAFEPGQEGYFVDSNGMRCNPCDFFNTRSCLYGTTPDPGACQRFVLDNVSKRTDSLMYTVADDEIYRFCDETTHNWNARNIHNMFCQDSVMTIIEQDQDFSKDCSGDAKQSINLPRNISEAELYPNITVVQDNDPRAIVFVLDVSGSMGEGAPYTKISILNKAVTSAVECMQIGERIGIVKFSTYAYTLLNMTTITSDPAVRKYIESKIPTQPEDNTAIGRGILLGLTVMQQIGQTNGGRLIVVSDGLENEGPNVYSNEVQSPLKAANVFVDTVAISNAASPMLSQLASDYGGQSFFLNTNDGASALNDAVSKMCQLSQAISGKSTAESVQVASQQIQINTFYAGQFLIDDSVGNETLLTFSGNLNIQVEVTRPNNGSVIGPTSPEYQTSNGNINIRIAYAEPGIWYYNITKLGNKMIEKFETGPEHLGGKLKKITRVRATNDNTISLLITSQARQVGEAIEASGSYNTANITEQMVESGQQFMMFAKVTKGSSPIINASVVTTVQDPASQLFTVVLKDNGVVPDATANDGIYTGIFNNFDGAFMGKGNRFSSFSQIDDNHGEAKYLTLVQGQIVGTPTGSFARVINNNQFTVLAQKAVLDADHVPPGPAAGFSETASNFSQSWVAISWTAPGDDGMVGQISHYDIRYTINSTDMYPFVKNFTSLMELVNATMACGDCPFLMDGPIVPVNGSEIQTIRIGNVYSNIPYMLGVQAIDKAGNNGSVATFQFRLLDSLATTATTIEATTNTTMASENATTTISNTTTATTTAIGTTTATQRSQATTTIASTTTTESSKETIDWKFIGLAIGAGVALLFSVIAIMWNCIRACEAKPRKRHSGSRHSRHKSQANRANLRNYPYY